MLLQVLLKMRGFVFSNLCEKRGRGDSNSFEKSRNAFANPFQKARVCHNRANGIRFLPEHGPGTNLVPMTGPTEHRFLAKQSIDRRFPLNRHNCWCTSVAECLDCFVAECLDYAFSCAFEKAWVCVLRILSRVCYCKLF